MFHIANIFIKCGTRLKLSFFYLVVFWLFKILNINICLFFFPKSCHYSVIQDKDYVFCDVCPASYFPSVPIYYLLKKERKNSRSTQYWVERKTEGKTKKGENCTNLRPSGKRAAFLNSKLSDRQEDKKQRVITQRHDSFTTGAVKCTSSA